MTAYPQFITGISVRYQGGASFAAFNRDVSGAADRVRNTTGRMRREAGANIDGVADRFRALGLAAQTAQGPFSSLGTRFNAISRSLLELGLRAGGAIAALAGGGALLAATAGFQNYTALLKSATDSQEEYNTALVRSFQIAKDSRSSLEGTIRLYARIKPALSEAGLGVAELGRLVETTNKALVLSGASTQEARAALIQFSQSLAAGRLSGDEYRSVAEQGNQLLLTIQQGIQRANLIEGFDGTRGALKKLADEQKLTTDIILRALEVMEEDVDLRFARMPVTIGQAATQIQTSTLELLQSFERTTGGLARTAKGLQFVAENLNIIAAAAVPLVARFLGVGPVLAAAAKGIATLGAAIGTGFTAATLRGAVATNALGVSLATLQNNTFRLALAQAQGSAAAVRWAQAQNAAAAAGSVLVTAGRGLLALFGGPLGLAITGVTIGLTAMAFQKDAVAKAAARMGIAEDDLRARLAGTSEELKDQNELLRENARLKDAQTVAGARGELGSARFAASNVLGSTQLGNLGALEQFRLVQGVRSGSITPQQTQERLRAAGFNEQTAGDAYRAVIEALTGVEAASLALETVTREQAIRDQKRAGSQAQASAQRLNDDTGLRPFGIDPALASRGIGGNLTNSQIKKLADQQAAELSALSEIEKARRNYAVREGQILNDPALNEVQKVAALSQERAALDQVVAAEKQRAEAAREQASAARSAAAEQKRIASEQARSQREQDQLTAAGERAAEQAERGAAAFLNLSEAQQIAANAAKALADIQAATGQPGGLNEQQAQQLRDQVARGAAEQLAKPYQDIVKSLEQEQQIQALLLQGREDEVELLILKNRLAEDGRSISENEEADLRRQLESIRAGNVLLEQRNRVVRDYANAAANVQGALTGGIRGLLDGRPGAVGDAAKQLIAGFKDVLAEQLSRALFGDLEQQAWQRMTNATEAAGNQVTDAVRSVEAAILGQPVAGSDGAPVGSASAGFANLPRLGPLGSVIGILAKPLETIGLLQKRSTDATEEATEVQRKNAISPFQAFNQFGAEIAKSLNIKGALGEVLGGAGDILGAYATADALTNLLGIEGKAAGAIKGGVTGASAGGKIGKAVGLPPGVGEAVGAVIGGIVGVISKTPRAYENLVVGADGFVNATSGGAQGRNQDKTKGAASELAGAVGEALQTVVTALGASLRPGSTIGSIGPVGDRFLFSTDTASRGSVKTNVQKFDTAEEALSAAIRSALDRGIIEGVRASTKRLILAGQDFTRQLDKAVKFESVFTRLRQFVDPVGARLESLNKEFEQLARIFDEAGASAAEYADLQRLYDLEREQAILETQSRLSTSLKQLIDDLTIGDAGLSLRDRRANAVAEFDRFSSDTAIQADPEGFAQAARALLDIERELFGSQAAYFARLNDITETARRLLGSENDITLPPAFSVGDRGLDTKPITDGLGTLGDRILGGLASVEDTLARTFAGRVAGGNFEIGSIQPRVNLF